MTAANLMAVGTLVVGLLMWAAGSFVFFTDVDRYPWYGKLGILSAAFVVQLSAQRRPAVALGAMGLLVALDAYAGPSLPLWIAVSDVMYIGVVRGSDRLRRVVIVLGVIATVAGAVAGVIAGGARAGVLTGLIGVALLLSPIGYGLSVVATRRAADAQKSAAVAQAQAERSAALADERRRLSRELHDTVAGHVSAIAILSEAARDADEPGPVVESIRGNSLAALRELRAMIDLLAADGDDITTVRWSSLDPLIAAADAVGSTVTVNGDTAGMPRRLEAVVTRIVGEALANATKHAPGHPVAVELSGTGDTVHLTVRNGWTGAEPSTTGQGLANMQIRAESVGGHLDARPVGQEWVVNAELPR
ncbi:two-component sensor histidine kinase [Gordonia spumicola]|uniref:histidine kinase n=1 Tax=Gordonia spumicola TaxID=589161 RepID=A0A7I9VEQ1_9ACTN|nr:two-component sensor histidine kinase [Gordonia spumicola]